MAVVRTEPGDVEGVPHVIYVEVADPAAPRTGADWADDTVRGGRAEKLVQSTRDMIGDGVDLARACAVRFTEGLRDLPGTVPVPEEIELQLGITLDAEVGAVLAKAAASAQIQITMTWKNGAASV